MIATRWLAAEGLEDCVAPGFADDGSRSFSRYAASLELAVHATSSGCALLVGDLANREISE
jgi:hypothetical protein